MKIDFLCFNDGGSPIGVTMKSLWGESKRIGCGGSELGMLTLCEWWTKKGYKVRLYNNPTDSNASPFEQLHIDKFDPHEDRDVLIVFRVPNPKAIGAKGLKVFLSFDQYTSAPFEKFFDCVDKVVGISDYHAEFFKVRYDFDKMIVIDLPLRVEDFQEISKEKVRNRLIYTSVPDRGLMNLHAIWPLIKRECADATLVITSDYRLWGVDNPSNQNFFIHWLGMEDVRFMGALLRKDYLKELCQADLFLYPHKSPNAELFCVSTSEAQFAGAYPITSGEGALVTTNMGTVFPGDPQNITWRKNFVQFALDLLNDRELLQSRQNEVIKKAFDRFHPDVILEQWENKVFNG